MKKTIALMMAGVIAFSTPMMVVHAESNGEWDLEEELTITENEDENKESYEDVEYDEDNMEDWISSSLWARTIHSDIAGSVMQYYASDPNRDTIEDCLRFAAKNADEAPLHTKTLNQLHGIHNYILHLHALWLYSKKIGSANQTDNNCKKEVLNKIKVNNPKDKPHLETLLNTIPEIYKLYCAEKGHQPTNFEKKYLVLGLSIHLIGDTYAHRTMVTIDGVDEAVKKGVVKESHFVSKAKYKEFRQAVKEGKVRCSMIDGNGWLKNDSVNPYEDNIKFMPNRYKYSQKVAKIVISNYVNKAAFSADYIKQSEADGIILERYDRYRYR